MKLRAKLLVAVLSAALILSACGRNEPAAESRSVPVLMYHHFADTGSGAETISASVFEEHMRAISEAGYTAVTVREMIDYVMNGGALPDKCVCITFDDGYESNITVAAPILEKYGMKATVFCIGVSAGKDTYKDTGTPIFPHFSVQQALEWESRGVLCIQSHTWDMHQSEQLDSAPVRYAVVPLDGESDEQYTAAIRSDCAKQRELFTKNGLDAPIALAYPHGEWTELSEKILHEEGILATFTTDPDGVNTLIPGKAESLYLLHRINVSDDMTCDAVLGYLDSVLLPQ